MVGIVKVDTLQNNAGTSSVDMDYVVNGTAKAWINFDGTSTGAVGDYDRGSFNFSVTVDNGTGDYTLGFASNMDNPNYTLTSATISDFSADRCVLGLSNDKTITTSLVRIHVIDAGNNAMRDQEYNFVTIHGDLA